jgi:di/tricarboxylate transporter
VSLDQIIAVAVMAGVVAALVHGRTRPDLVALCGAALLLVTGTVRPSEVQGAFASPALIALASLFVIASAVERSGLLALAIRHAAAFSLRVGAFGLWQLIVACGAASAFLNNTPLVLLGAPVVKDVARRLDLDPKRFLIPLSYVAIMGGSTTLIGTSTNLLVNDMARNAGQPTFSLFEITPVAVAVAVVGAATLFFLAGPLLKGAGSEPGAAPPKADLTGDAMLGTPDQFQADRPLDPVKAAWSAGVFAAVVAVAASGLLPIAAAAFGGAVLLVLVRAINLDEAYRGLNPEVLFLIAGMVVVGVALEVTGLAAAASDLMVAHLAPMGPLMALIVLYGATLLLTEVLSNAAVAVLVTPVAVAIAESLGVSPRPFLVAVMLAASAAFATPFGYQTNVLVYRLGGYGYMDFVRIGVPLNLVTWAAAAIVIPQVFPF